MARTRSPCVLVTLFIVLSAPPSRFLRLDANAQHLDQFVHQTGPDLVAMESRGPVSVSRIASPTIPDSVDENSSPDSSDWKVKDNPRLPPTADLDPRFGRWPNFLYWNRQGRTSFRRVLLNPTRFDRVLLHFSGLDLSLLGFWPLVTGLSRVALISINFLLRSLRFYWVPLDFTTVEPSFAGVNYIEFYFFTVDNWNQVEFEFWWILILNDEWSPINVAFLPNVI